MEKVYNNEEEQLAFLEYVISMDKKDAHWFEHHIAMYVMNDTDITFTIGINEFDIYKEYETKKGNKQ